MRDPLAIEQWLYQMLSTELGAKVYSFLPHRPILPYVQFTEIKTEPWLIKPPSELITIYLEIHSEQTSNVEVLRLMAAINNLLRSHKPEGSIRTDIADTHAFHDQARWTAGMRITFYNIIKE
jgi:hypothetical protein